VPILPSFQDQDKSDFGRRVGAGYLAALGIGIAITLVSVLAFRSVIATNDRESFELAGDLLDIQKLRTVTHRRMSYGLEPAAEMEFRAAIERLRKHANTEAEKTQLARLESFRSSLHSSKPFRGTRVLPHFDTWERALDKYALQKEHAMEAARQIARHASRRALNLIFLISISAVGLAVALATILTRTLTRAHEKMRMAIRAREDVLAVVSHDLKNPLSAVMLSASLLARNPELPVDARVRSARTIQTSAQQMKKLIDDLLDFVQAELGNLRVSRKPEDPDALLADVMGVFAPLAREKRIELTRALSGEVPYVNCDRARVYQALSNLVANALKFTPGGGKVTVQVRRDDEGTLFSVRDTGPGIPAKNIPRLFDRYWQGESNERKLGMGLGLAIAKGVVEAHGGRIWAESSVGAGSLFTFLIPDPHTTQASDHGFTAQGLRTAILSRIPHSSRAKQAVPGDHEPTFQPPTKPS
jgi:signal transduction histidine kinase